MECWLVKISHVQKGHVVGMKMSRWTYGHTGSDKMMNEVIQEKVRVTSEDERTKTEMVCACAKEVCRHSR